jgi:hypothetical protein
MWIVHDVGDGLLQPMSSMVAKFMPFAMLVLLLLLRDATEILRFKKCLLCVVNLISYR